MNYKVIDDFGYNNKIFVKGTIFDSDVVKFDSQTIAWLKCNESIMDYNGEEIKSVEDIKPLKEEIKTVKKKRGRKSSGK